MLLGTVGLSFGIRACLKQRSCSRRFNFSTVVLLKGKVAWGGVWLSPDSGALQRLIDSRDAHLVVIYMEVDISASLQHMSACRITDMHVTLGNSRPRTQHAPIVMRQSWSLCWPPSPPSFLFAVH